MSAHTASDLTTVLYAMAELGAVAGGPKNPDGSPMTSPQFVAAMRPIVARLKSTTPGPAEAAFEVLCADNIDAILAP